MGTMRNEVQKRKHNEAMRKYRYGISSNEYEAMLEKQHGLCAICQKPPEQVVGHPRGRRLFIDHNHKCCSLSSSTGIKKSCGKCIRGLLCSSCNYILGIIKDDEQIIDRAKLYLQG